MKVLVYSAHPGLHHSKANVAMTAAVADLDGIEFVDLCALYPRYRMDVAKEQVRLVEHDVIIMQFPLFWYSSPAIVKEWQDLVLQHGFAYGSEGTALSGKWFGVAVTCGGPREAYRPDGLNRHELRTFLTPLEQTARLCGMRFIAPYTLFGSLEARESGGFDTHAAGWKSLLEALRDDRYDVDRADELSLLEAEHLKEVIR